MKQLKISKVNILLTAIVALLIFVAGFNLIGLTGSWLEDNEEVVFNTQVTGINIVLKQNDVEITDNKIKIPTNIIEADTTYDMNVTITNDENTKGYYVRFRVVALVNGTQYNINNLIATDFYKHPTDGWMYHTANPASSTLTQMDANTSASSTRRLLTSFSVPSTAETGLSIANLQGKHFRLFMFIEGSTTETFE